MPPAAPPIDGGLAGPFGSSPLFGPVVGHVPYSASYRVTWLPDEPVRGQDTHLGVVAQAASVLFPLWQCDRDEFSGTVRVQGQSVSTHAVLPDTMQNFPDQLWEVRFGGTCRHLFDNGWIAGGGVSVGSASNEPFHSVNELTVGVNVFQRVPSGERNAWLLTLSYSPTGVVSGTFL